MNTNVLAKFKVVRIELTPGSKHVGKDSFGRDEYEPCTMHTVVMSPVYANNDPDHENYKFWQTTPTGEIRLGTINSEAAAAFELGKEYYVEFSAAMVPA